MTVLASIALMIAVIVGWVLYLYFGPRGWFLAFAFGASTVAGIAWIGFHSPALLVAAGNSASGQAAGAFLNASLESAQNVDHAQRTLATAFRWTLTLLFGALAVAVAVISILGSSTIGGNVPKDVTILGMLTGIFSAMSGIAWFNIGRY